MRVNPEQASKVKLRASTRLNNGEDRRVRAKQPSLAAQTARRGNGSGMWRKRGAQRGKPEMARCRRPQRFYRRRLSRVAEGHVGLMKPGNSGGGKEPYFWSAFEGSPVGRLA